MNNFVHSAPRTGRRPAKRTRQASKRGSAGGIGRVAQGRVVVPPYHRPLTFRKCPSSSRVNLWIPYTLNSRPHRPVRLALGHAYGLVYIPSVRNPRTGLDRFSVPLRIIGNEQTQSPGRNASRIHRQSPRHDKSVCGDAGGNGLNGLFGIRQSRDRSTTSSISGPKAGRSMRARASRASPAAESESK